MHTNHHIYPQLVSHVVAHRISRPHRIPLPNSASFVGLKVEDQITHLNFFLILM